MTCFSIQKFVIFTVFLAVLSGFIATSATAQDMRNPDGTKMTAEEAQKAMRVDAPILVELFTASDCSSCILADRLLYDAAKDKNVIALSCHMEDLGKGIVDGKVEEEGDDNGVVTKGPMDPCIFRQWTYKANFGMQDVSIQIPEFVINGVDKVSGQTLPMFPNMVDNYHYMPRNKSLEILGQWKDKDTIMIHLPEINGEKELSNSASVWIIRYKDMAVEKISTGVNAGKVLRFSNIIQDIRHVGKWHGKMRTIEVDVPKPQGGKERGGYVFVVQEVMGDPVLAAGKLEDYPMPNDLKRSAEPQTAKPQTMELDNVPAPVVPPKP